MDFVSDPEKTVDRDQKFVSLVDRYQEPLLRMCCLYLCDQSLAEDAVQETFLKVYRSMEQFRGESSEKTWIMRIAMHVCYDINHTSWFRNMNRKLTPEMLADETADVQPDEYDLELAAAVMKLPRKLREVILLYYYQGMKANEIAEALNLAGSSVSGRLVRGREKLKAMLEGSEFDE